MLYITMIIAGQADPVPVVSVGVADSIATEQ